MLLSSSLLLPLRCAVWLKSLAIQGKFSPLSQKIERLLLFCRSSGYDGQIAERRDMAEIAIARRTATKQFGSLGTPCFCALGIVVSLGSCGRKKLRKTAAKRLKSFTRVNLCAGPYAICMPSS